MNKKYLYNFLKHFLLVYSLAVVSSVFVEYLLIGAHVVRYIILTGFVVIFYYYILYYFPTQKNALTLSYSHLFKWLGRDLTQAFLYLFSLSLAYTVYRQLAYKQVHLVAEFLNLNPKVNSFDVSDVIVWSIIILHATILFVGLPTKNS